MHATPLIDVQTGVVLKRSLILAGGGMRLAWQGGVLQALQQAGLQFNHVDGTSGGIFNTAMLASGASPDEVSSRWRKLNVKYFMSYRPPGEYLQISRLKGFGDGDGIRNKVLPSLGINLAAINNNKSVNATFNVCNFSDKTIECLPNQALTEDHLIAGVSLPMFMPALQINGAWYSDGVWIKDANLMNAVKSGAEEIWLIWAIGNSHEYLEGSFNQYVHMIEMSANGGLFAEFEQITFLNERIEKGDSPYGQHNPIRIYIIKPEYPLPLDPDLFFNKITTSALVNMGYADACNYLDVHPWKLIKPGMNATKMREPGTVFSFGALFSGKLGNTGGIRYKIFFQHRKSGPELTLHSYSEIYIPQFNQEVSTKKNVTIIRRLKGNPTLNIKSEFEIEKATYFLECTIELTATVNWLFALEFKNARIRIWQSTKTSTTMSWAGTLTQSLGQRIRGLINSSIRNATGNFRFLARYQMISNLYTYEI